MRSSAVMNSAANRTGAARTASTDVVSTPHTKIGSRFHVSPGARWVITVAIMFSPTSASEIPISANETMYASIPPRAWSDSGA